MISRSAGRISIVNCRVSLNCGSLTSLTCTVKVHSSLLVGVPLISPVELFKVRPYGRLPLLIDQVYGSVPPVALIILL